MPYQLGVDLGTTYTCAAVRRDGATKVVQLGTESQAMASVLAIRDDGELIAGEAAERRAATHPARAVREFKRRFGDPAPIVLGGRAWSAHDLTARLLREVIDRTTAIEGEAPEQLALAHPASWGPFRLDVLRAAAADVGFPEVVLVPEPVAAARANSDRMSPGSLVAVYDLGGGTFDAAVVRNEAPLSIVGTPEGVERLGGVDFDQAILNHVDVSLGGVVSSTDPADADAAAALTRLRDECRRAKEALAADTEVEIPALLPNVRSSVRLTRAELENMIRPRLADSLAVLDRVVASTGSPWEDISGVLLVGGSSRIPLIGLMVTEHTGRPVLTATNPAFSIALGTVQALAETPDATAPSATPARADIVPPATAGQASTAERAPTRPGRGKLLAVGAAVAAVAIAIAAVVALSGGDDTAAPTATQPVAVSTPSTITPNSTVDATTPATGAPSGPDPVDVAGMTLSPTVCEGSEAATAGAVDIAVADELVFVLAGGEVQALTLEAGCTLAPDPDVTSTLTFGDALTSISTDADGRLAGAGLNGGGIVEPDGTYLACDLLLDRTYIGQDGKFVLTWRRGGAVKFLTTGVRGCTEDRSLPTEFAVVDIAGDSGQTFLLATEAAGNFAISRVTGLTPQWTQGNSDPLAADGYSSIDGIGRCGSVICVLDAKAGRLHLLSTEGAHLGAADVATLFGVSSASRLTVSPDGMAYLLATIDGTIRLVRLDVS